MTTVVTYRAACPRCDGLATYTCVQRADYASYVSRVVCTCTTTATSIDGTWLREGLEITDD